MSWVWPSSAGHRARLLLLGLCAGLGAGWLVADLVAPRVGSGLAAFSSDPPLGYTGAPEEVTCAQCHTGTGGNGSVDVQGVPAAYNPEQTYALSVVLQDPGQSRWGFELTALRFDSGSLSHVRAGSLTRTSNFTSVRDAFDGRQYVSHHFQTGFDGSFAGTPGPTTWNFSWTAPAAGEGTVTFYVAGNAANNSSGPDGGDFIYTNSVSSTEGSSTATTFETSWGKIKNQFR